jgi:2-amino-4-hydroxy-6-hydroxymethyldihydropteridine diphosphokinase
MARMLAHIGMGSNIGDRGDTLMRAVKLLSEVDGVAVRRLSQFVRTEPLGGPADQPVYFNAAVEAAVELSPRELLAALQDIERRLGRDRPREQRWGPRTCDLDILLMGETVVREEPDLVIPHPRMHERAFVLEPLWTIAPQAVHPVLGKTVSEMLDDVRSGRVKPSLQPPEEPPQPGRQAGQDESPDGAAARQAPLLSIIGLPASGKTTLAELLAMELPGRLVPEDYQGNPFLAESYAGPDEMRLPAQVFYLLSRVSQLSGNHWPAGGTFVSDYGFCQDRVYAWLRLSPEDFAAYEALHARVAPLVHPPRAMVYLDAEPRALLERIAVRGRSFEKAITTDFLSAMRDAYNELVKAAECPVFTVRCDEVDLRNHRPRAELIKRIRTVL